MSNRLRRWITARRIRRVLQYPLIDRYITISERKTGSMALYLRERGCYYAAQMTLSPYLYRGVAEHRKWMQYHRREHLATATPGENR